MSLANKYRPKTFDDVTEQKTTVQIIQNICNSELSNKNFLLTGPAGCGKAQPMYSKILTPNGFIEMKDVQIGTKVFTAKGNIGKVSGIYPQGIRPIYEITLQDRTKIRVSDEHINVFYRYNDNMGIREDYKMTTMELINFFKTSSYKLRMDIPVIEFENNSPLPIDPYLLGVLIGDGCLHKNFRISNPEQDILDKVNAILKDQWDMQLLKLSSTKCDYKLSKIPGTTYKYGSDSLRSTLKDLGLLTNSVDKYLPKQYLLTSKENRIKLLQGLFDTDGTISKNGTVTFTTCSQQLSEDFAFLVRSLGIRDTISTSKSKYRKDGEYIYTGTICYDHHLKISNSLKFFTSDKHTKAWHPRMFEPMRNITNIEYVGDEECQCIMIDHPEHTYISDGFIPTHNTTLARIMANTINDGNMTNYLEIDAATHGNVDSIRELMELAKTYPMGSKYRVIVLDEVHSVSSGACWAAMLKTLESDTGNTIFIFATTNPEKIPDTILSRVQTFQLSKISLDGIYKRLKYVLDQEKAEGADISYTDDAVYFIAKLANGGMRDALTLTDKALAYDKHITSESLVTALNLPNYDDFFTLLSAYAKHDNPAIVELVDKVYNSGVNFVKWFENFHAFIMNIVKYIFTQDINSTMIPIQYQDRISKYSVKQSAICLSLSNKIVSLLSELSTTTHLQEMALTYLCSIPKPAQPQPVQKEGAT